MDDSNFIKKMSHLLDDDLEYQETLNGYLKEILPDIRHDSEDLRETEFYLEKPWLEFRDDASFHEVILHYFNENNEYLKSVDGNVAKGNWRTMKGNKLLIEMLSGHNIVKSELYDLMYLDDEFFILKKHGDREDEQTNKFMFLAHEVATKGMTWREAAELLYQDARKHSPASRLLFIFIILLALFVIIFSLF